MLKIQTKKLDAVAILSLSGQIVTGETEGLRTAVRSLRGVRAVILDLNQVDIVDAGGLGVLLALRERAQTEGISFKLMNVSKWVSRVLQIAHLDSVFQIASSVEIFPAGSQHRRVAMSPLASCA